MKKRYLIICLLIEFSAIILKAQPYGNEWIVNNQVYFKLAVPEDGIYRINYDELQSAGFPVGTNVDPRRIQLFYRGNEVAIHIEGQNDATLDSTDFIAFYGQRNNGTLDQEMLLSPADQVPRYYNMYSDSSYYFLTWRLDGINGKRITNYTENNVDGLPSETYHWNEKLLLYSDNYSPGKSYNTYTYMSAIDNGEGWTGTRIGKGTSRDFTFSGLDDANTSGPDPQLQILIAGRNNNPHNVRVEIGPSVSGLRYLGNFTFEGQIHHTYDTTINWSDIGIDGNLVVRLIIEGYPEYTADYVSVTHALVKYPELYETGGADYKVFSLPDNVNGKSFIEINNVIIQDKLLDITDINNPVDIGFNVNANSLSAVVRNTFSSRRLVLTSERLPVSSINKINFKKFDPLQANYLIIYHKDFTSPSGNYSNPVQAYAGYRAENQNGTGPFDTLTIEISTIYNQFSYGEYTPLGIRNFCRYMVNEGSPDYLLLIGKGLTVNNNPVRNYQPDAEFKDWIPPAGFPGSDILFSSGLNGSTYEPAIPTGRITAKSALELANYLDKAKEADAFQFEEQWKKDILQLSGGRSEGELALFRSYIDIFKSRAESLYLGGKATNKYKETKNVVESFDIAQEVNDGKSLILFFGHSAPSVTDIDIGFVSDPIRGYQNKGKYPFMLINGCDAGDIYNKSLTFGEDWIITGEKGAVGFVAHSGTGYTGLLKRFSDSFFDTAYGDSSFIYQSMGKVMKEVAKRFLSENYETETVYAQVQQNILQGDPAIKIFGADKPEYGISPNEIKLETTDNKPINSLTDSFNIAVIVKNLGRGDSKPFYMSVKRSIASTSEEITYNPVQYNPVLYQDTLLFNVSNLGTNGSGLNTFEIQIDPFDSIGEMYDRKYNNTAVFNQIIKQPGPLNLFPYDYAIVGEADMRLLAQPSDLTGGSREFIFQIDTSADFNSPIRRDTSMSSSILAEWPISLFRDFPETDSLAFYWRTKYATIREGEDSAWVQYSFNFVKNGPEGWAQIHIDQLQENEIEGMLYDNPTEKWNYLTSESTIDATTFGVDYTEKTYEDVTLSINGVPYNISNPFTGFCSDNSLNAIAFDNVSSNPYRVLPPDNFFEILDRKTCGRQPQVINNFLNTEIEGVNYNLSTYIDNVPIGDPVLIFSIGEIMYNTWSDELKSKLTEIGASTSLLNSMSNGEPYILLGYKGAPEGTALEIVANSSLPIPGNEQQIELHSIINGQSTSGRITSKMIGPSKTWYDFYNQITNIDAHGEEDAYFQISGIKKDNTTDMLYNHVTDSYLNLSGINASQYPYLKTTFITSDTSALTPASLDSWIITFEPMPEGILYPDPDSDIKYPIIKQEGELVSTNYIFRNISDQNFDDSLSIFHYLFNQALNKRIIDSLKIGPIPSNTQHNFTIENKTKGMVGDNDLEIFVNPNIIPEKYYTNNQLSLADFLSVKKDNVNPNLDVAFDGRYILDGEIVSPNPHISIRYKDDNTYIPKVDTSGIKIFLTYPESNGLPGTTKPIYFGDNPEITYAADSAKSSFIVDYKPNLKTDGIYELRVQAEDESGNASGTEPYRIRFEVINESQITNFYPYPNPFSSSTRFIFTLTGTVIPDQFKIQIMTISGKVVREIMADEIGPIRIGNNITDYAWDGRDEFGDQLANGVYLYRIIMGNNGQSFKHRSTSGDKGFTKGFGKLYLLR